MSCYLTIGKAKKAINNIVSDWKVKLESSNISKTYPSLLLACRIVVTKIFP